MILGDHRDKNGQLWAFCDKPPHYRKATESYSKDGIWSLRTVTCSGADDPTNNDDEYWRMQYAASAEEQVAFEHLGIQWNRGFIPDTLSGEPDGSDRNEI
jgi:hypothetical protein